MDVLTSVEGAGISMAQKLLRVPLGWSSDAVGTAEQIQTTLGAGPCLSAVQSGAPSASDASVLADRWPVYYDELSRLTPYRSVASIPLQVDGTPAFGALDLYASSTDLSSTLQLADIADAIARPIAVILSGAFTRLYDDDPYIPEWLDADPAVERMTVWTAVGMLISASPQSDEDALATLRAWAYGHGLSLDEVANDVVERITSLEAVLGG